MIQVEIVEKPTREVEEAIGRLLPQLNPSAKPLAEEELQGIVSSSTTALLIARETENNEIIGMITLVWYRIPFTQKAWLEDFVVDENARGKGVGQLLLNEALKIAKEKGLDAVNLTSSVNRENANQLYQKLGFEKRDTNVYKVKLQK